MQGMQDPRTMSRFEIYNKDPDMLRDTLTDAVYVLKTSAINPEDALPPDLIVEKLIEEHETLGKLRLCLSVTIAAGGSASYVELREMVKACGMELEKV